MKHRVREFVAERWRELHTAGDSGEATARGFALGLGLGFLPLSGLKTLLALIAAPWLRGNRVAAVLGTTLHDLTLPLAPVLLRLEYDLGFWLLQRPHRWPPGLHMHHLHAHEWMSWTTFIAVVPPLLVGSLIVALPVAALAYVIVRRALSSLDDSARR